MTTRRSFLGAILAAAAAPALVRADSLMRLAPSGKLFVWGDGIHDDTLALQAFFDGKVVSSMQPGIQLLHSPEGYIRLSSGIFLVGSTIHLHGKNITIEDCTFKPSSGFQDTILHAHAERIEDHSVTPVTRQSQWPPRRSLASR